MKEIYLDHAATTYVRNEVLGVMNKYFQEEYGNPGSFHTIGLRPKRAMAKARELVRDLINAKQVKEIIFTGSGTESVNLAIKGITEGAHQTLSYERPEKDVFYIRFQPQEGDAVETRLSPK